MPEISHLPLVIIVGNHLRNEFRPIAEDICSNNYCVQIFLKNLHSICEHKIFANSCELIVLFESYPNEFLVSEIDQLQRYYPLTRIVLIAGTLAEGETRTGRVSNSVFRSYWYQWESDVLQEFNRFCRGEHSVWHLPSMASEEEKIHASCQMSPLLKKSLCPAAKKTLIFSNDMGMSELLADIVSSNGYISQTFLPQEIESQIRLLPNDFSLIFFDVTEEDTHLICDDIEKIHCYLSKASIILICFGVHISKKDAFIKAGATRVIGKPTTILNNQLFFEFC